MIRCISLREAACFFCVWVGFTYTYRTLCIVKAFLIVIKLHGITATLEVLQLFIVIMTQCRNNEHNYCFVIDHISQTILFI